MPIIIDNSALFTASFSLEKNISLFHLIISKGAKLGLLPRHGRRVERYRLLIRRLRPCHGSIAQTHDEIARPALKKKFSLVQFCSSVMYFEDTCHFGIYAPHEAR